MNRARIMGVCMLMAAPWHMTLAYIELGYQIEETRAELARVEAEYAEQARLCYQKLHVNACRQAVQKSRSERIRPMQERLRSLESEMRAERAKGRREDLRQRQLDHDLRLKPGATLPSEPVDTSVPRQP